MGRIGSDCKVELGKWLDVFQKLNGNKRFAEMGRSWRDAGTSLLSVANVLARFREEGAFAFLRGVEERKTNIFLIVSRKSRIAPRTQHFPSKCRLSSTQSFGRTMHPRNHTAMQAQEGDGRPVLRLDHGGPPSASTPGIQSEIDGFPDDEVVGLRSMRRNNLPGKPRSASCCRHHR